ncbi:hypothetical protein LEN26_004057, partial [Aphanomyces euteiches]
QPAWINRSLKVEEGDIINVRSVPKLPTQPKNIADLAKAHHAMTKNAVAKANADAARHKAKVSQLTVELSTLKTKITQIEASTAAASEANEEMIKSLETEREELKSQVQKINAAWTKEKSEHDVVIKTLRGQVSSLEESTRALTFDLDKNQQEKADLTDQLSALNGKLNFANSYVNDLEAVLRKTEAASAANERMMRRLEDEREDLQAQVEMLTGTQANERSKYDTTIKLLENKVETLLEANASAGILMADLRAEISSLESNAMEMADMHESVLAIQQRETLQLKDQINKYRRRRHARRMLATLRSDFCNVKALQDDKRNLQDQLKKVERELEMMRQTLERVRSASDFDLSTSEVELMHPMNPMNPPRIRSRRPPIGKLRSNSFASNSSFYRRDSTSKIQQAKKTQQAPAPPVDIFAELIHNVVSLFDNQANQGASQPPIAPSAEHQDDYNYEDMLREHGLAPPNEEAEEAQNLMEQRFRAMSSSSRKRSDSNFSAVSSMTGCDVTRWSRGSRCKECNCEFNILVRRHICRRCGFSYCFEHSTRRIALPSQGYKDPVRVCDGCFEWASKQFHLGEDDIYSGGE